MEKSGLQVTYVSVIARATFLVLDLAIKNSTDNVFVVIFVHIHVPYVNRRYFYRISLVRKWYYIVVSHIVLLKQLTDGTIQTNDHNKRFVEEVAVIWHVNIKKDIVFRIWFSPNPYRIVYQNRTYMV